MFRVPALFAACAALSIFASNASAQIIVVTAGRNVTSGNSPIEGLNTGNYAQYGISYTQFEGTSFGAAGSLIDGNTGSYDTTYSDPLQGRSSFAGIEGSGLQASSNTSGITYLQVVFRLFVDGGWFGPNNTDPGGDVPLLPTDLTAPVVQVTTDGTTWTTVADQNDYVEELTGALHDNGLNSNTVTFALSAPQTDIEGIRIIGSSGGVAGGDQGFVGFTELAVYSGGTLDVPEPSTFALGALGFAGLLVLARRRFVNAA